MNKIVKSSLIFLLNIGLAHNVMAITQEKHAVIAPPSQSTYFPLNNIRLLDSPFKDLQRRGKDYLLWLNPDSLLHFYLIEAGLQPKAAPYAGWESQDVWGGGPLRGGFLGFYLSSVSMMYQATGDKELLEKLKYVLKELEICQQAGGDGFLLGVKDGRKLFQEVAAGNIETSQPTVNGSWAPVYLLNKMLLGLSAAYTQCGLQDALPLLTKLADWFGTQVLDKLTDEQIQKILVCEHGSINESFVDVYELTGEKRFLDWAYRLHDKAMWVPLSEGNDILYGWHANTQIPKFTGFYRYYEATGDKRFLNAATYFWQIVARNHTWVIGGNSSGEHFFPKAEFAKKVLEVGGPETCNSVNMLRLTEALFAHQPDAEKAAYYERVLFNHILSAYDPQKGMCCYYTSMRPAHYRLYASCDSSFWCCAHTGLESPAKLGRFIYSHEENDIRVNLFIPSVLSWKEKGVELIQQNKIPESDMVQLTLNLKKKQQFRLYIRKPEWAVNPVLKINGNIESPVTDNNGYWVIDKEWNKNNTITLCLPMQVYTEKLQESSRYVSLLYGPYVLAGRMGKEKLPTTFWGKMNNVAMDTVDLRKTPIFHEGKGEIPTLVKRVSNNPLMFKIQAKGFEKIPIEPFYKIHFERYTIYWPTN